MSTLFPLTHLAGISATGLGALMSAWLVWRLWRRLFRAAIAFAVIGLAAYVMFPNAVAHVIRDERAPATTSDEDR
jgi:hypothetical protein